MENIRNFFSRIFTWVKSNPLEFGILLAILLIGAFLRLYHIEGYMTFLGDEGRDMIIVRRLLVNFDPILIGPGTSVGNMYLGPLYYYLIAPALLLSNFSPVGPSVFVALVGVITIAFIWYVNKLWFNNRVVSLIVAFLYAISPVAIIMSRSSWNPNVMPFFALLCIFSIWKVVKEEKFNWLIVLGLSFAFVLQSHYLGFLLVPPLGIFWLVGVYKFVKEGKAKEFFVKTLLGLLAFLVLMSPLFIFDLRHNWMNARAFSAFFSQNGTLSTDFGTTLSNIPSIWEKINTRLLGSKNNVLGLVLSWSMLVGLIAVDLKKTKGKDNLRWIVLWLGLGVFGLTFYRGEIYDHYTEFLFPALYLLLGGLLSFISEDILGKILLISVVGILTVFSIKASPLKDGEPKQVERAREVAALISRESAGKNFNLAVIADTNYEDGYEYFLQKNNEKMIDINPLDYKATLTDQLFVVCELPKERCKPVNNPKSEVANFGWSKIAQQWDQNGVIIYKLVHVK